MKQIPDVFGWKADVDPQGWLAAASSPLNTSFALWAERGDSSAMQTVRACLRKSPAYALAVQGLHRIAEGTKKWPEEARETCLYALRLHSGRCYLAGTLSQEWATRNITDGGSSVNTALTRWLERETTDADLADTIVSTTVALSCSPQYNLLAIRFLDAIESLSDEASKSDRREVALLLRLSAECYLAGTMNRQTASAEGQQ